MLFVMIIMMAVKITEKIPTNVTFWALLPFNITCLHQRLKWLKRPKTQRRRRRNLRAVQFDFLKSRWVEPGFCGGGGARCQSEEGCQGDPEDGDHDIDFHDHLYHDIDYHCFFFRSTRFVPDHLDDDIDECFLPGVRDMWWMFFFSRSARYVLQRVEAVIAVVEHFQTTLDSPGKHISYHLVNNKWTNEHNVDPLTWQLP